jgi:hypothetical protein
MSRQSTFGAICLRVARARLAVEGSRMAGLARLGRCAAIADPAPSGGGTVPPSMPPGTDLAGISREAGVVRALRGFPASCSNPTIAVLL